MSFSQYQAMVGRLSLADFNRYQFRRNGRVVASAPAIGAGDDTPAGGEK